MPRRSYGEFMSQVFSQPVVERFQTRKRRRTMVTLVVLNYSAITLVCLFAPAWWWLWVPLYCCLFPLFSFINMSVRGVTEIPLSHLDEWQAHLRLNAYHDAYRLGLIFALAGATGLYYLYCSGWYGGPANIVFAPLMGVLSGILIGLPSKILAWQLQDENPEEPRP